MPDPLVGSRTGSFRVLGLTMSGEQGPSTPHPSVQMSSEYREYADSFGKVSVTMLARPYPPPRLPLGRGWPRNSPCTLLPPFRAPDPDRQGGQLASHRPQRPLPGGGARTARRQVV